MNVVRFMSPGHCAARHGNSHPLAPPATDVGFQGDLMAWHDANRRDLPWRRPAGGGRGGRDPYAVWVSETMLQQTRVETAKPYFERWMSQLPTLADLAAAEEMEVLRLWSGLGYYRRARNLHRAARHLVAAGKPIPCTATALRDLPGIGAYTAGAVASIAFGEPVAAVDANVLRVARRIAAIRGDARKVRDRVERLAASWVPADRPGDWNEALMDLGATVCTPRVPRCGDCPVATACEANRLGLAHKLPPPRPRKKAPLQRMHFAVVLDPASSPASKPVATPPAVLLVRTPPGLLGGLWALPGGPVNRPLGRMVQEQTGITVRIGSSHARARHSFTHRTWDMAVRRATVVSGVADGPERPEPMDGVTWMPVAELSQAAISAAMRRALEAAGIGIEDGRRI